VHTSAQFPASHEHDVLGSDEITSADEDRRSSASSRRDGWHHSRFKCPRCAKAHVKRSPREGLKEIVLSSMYVYPYECRACGYRFKMLEWGIRYRRTRREDYR
jgi:hypothetical protein